MNHLNIAFDLDNTLVNFSRIFDIMAESLFDAYCVDPSDYNYEKSHNLTPEQRAKCLEEAFKYPHLTPAYFGAPDLLKTLWINTGDPITVITARPIEVATETHKLVSKKLCPNIPYTLIFTEVKAHYLSRFKYYVEDHPDSAWMFAAQMNMKVFLIDQPYNQDLEHTNIQRIKDPSELLKDPIMFMEER